MKDLRKWAANTAFDAAMPLFGVILFEAGPVLLLLLLVLFLIWKAAKNVKRIKIEKEKANETETEQTDKKAE